MQQRRQTTETIDPHQLHDGALPMLLEWLKRLKTAAAQGDHRQLTISPDGSTPLHLAASSDARPWNGLLRRLSPRQIWSWSGWHATKVLLDANVSTAYQADNQGSYAVHAAAWSGSLGVVQLLLETCPKGGHSSMLLLRRRDNVWSNMSVG